jgi:hypothetical protein
MCRLHFGTNFPKWKKVSYQVLRTVVVVLVLVAAAIVALSCLQGNESELRNTKLDKKVTKT